MTSDAERDAARRRQHEEAPELLSLVRLLQQARRRPLLTYRCRAGAKGRSGCLLLSVYRLPDGGHLLHRPARKLQQQHSESVLIESVEFAGRLSTLEHAAGGRSIAGLSECRHTSVKTAALTTERVRADLAAGRAVVILPDNE